LPSEVQVQGAKMKEEEECWETKGHNKWWYQSYDKRKGVQLKCWLCMQKDPAGKRKWHSQRWLQKEEWGRLPEGYKRASSFRLLEEAGQAIDVLMLAFA